MLKPVLNRKPVLPCLADCPEDNHARQFAQFLYETLGSIFWKIRTTIDRSEKLH